MRLTCHERPPHTSTSIITLCGLLIPPLCGEVGNNELNVFVEHFGHVLFLRSVAHATVLAVCNLISEILFIRLFSHNGMYILWMCNLRFHCFSFLGSQMLNTFCCCEGMVSVFYCFYMKHCLGEVMW